MTPERARPDELPDAFRLLFHGLPSAERDERVAHALALVQQGALDPAGVLVERDPSGVLGVLVCQPVAGAGALIWPPQSADDPERAAREDRLVQEATRWLRERGAKVAQALLPPGETASAAPLERNGFRHITHLWYLRRELDSAAALPDEASTLHYRPFDTCEPGLFGETLQRTYQGTLDCPEVNGARTIDEVIAGHQAQGRFDPGRWWLALRNDRPVGVVLLSELAESGDWEVAYMGLVPEARRQGLGRQLLLQALHAARAAAVRYVILSVDGRNHPAWQLYVGAGFEPYDRREVYLAVWTL
jgi:ribosomal protein S18 acetylase RimI-like enzyme